MMNVFKIRNGVQNVLVLATFLWSSAASANGADSFRVKVLGCMLPVPVQYVLDGTSDDGIVLMQEPEAAGHIHIGKFSGYPERFTILSEKTTGHLTISELGVNTTGRPLEPVIAIRDDKHIVSLIGAARDLLDVFVEVCVKRGD
jgi:hypothetical protein